MFAKNMDINFNVGNTNYDLVNMKGVVYIITTYHLLSAIKRNLQFYDPGDGIDYYYNNNHIATSGDANEEYETSSDLYLKDAF